MRDNANQQRLPAGHRTWHLAPEEIWSAHAEKRHYVPETFEVEGFMHCTNDLQELVAVGNRYYRNDPRSYVALEIDCDLIDARIVYEDVEQMFPHIYGRLNHQAVTRILTVTRDADGTFRSIGM